MLAGVGQPTGLCVRLDLSSILFFEGSTLGSRSRANLPRPLHAMSEVRYPVARKIRSFDVWTGLKDKIAV